PCRPRSSRSCGQSPTSCCAEPLVPLELPRQAIQPRGETAVDGEHGAVDEGSLIRGQKDGSSGNVVGLADTTYGVPLLEPLENVGARIDAGLPDRCPHGTRANDVGPHAAPGVADSQVLAEVDHARLRGAVCLLAEAVQAI